MNQFEWLMRPSKFEQKLTHTVKMLLNAWRLAGLYQWSHTVWVRVPQRVRELPRRR